MRQRSPHKFDVGDLIENYENDTLGLVVDKTDLESTVKSYFRVWWLDKDTVGYRISLVSPRDARVRVAHPRKEREPK